MTPKRPGRPPKHIAVVRRPDDEIERVTSWHSTTSCILAFFAKNTKNGQVCTFHAREIGAAIGVSTRTIAGNLRGWDHPQYQVEYNPAPNGHDSTWTVRKTERK